MVKRKIICLVFCLLFLPSLASARETVSISELKATAPARWVCEIQTKEGETVTMVPLLPITSQGGTLNEFADSIQRFDCEKIASPIKGVDFAITISGDSMEPEYPNGSMVFIQKINEKAFKKIQRY